MDDLLAIGAVAEQAGVATSTLRDYDDIGLVRPTTRVRGRRRYNSHAVRRLRIIDLCQQAAFTLEEIARRSRPKKNRSCCCPCVAR